MRIEIATLGTALVVDRKYLVCWFENSNTQVFSGLVNVLVMEISHSKYDIYVESQMTADAYANG